MQSLLKHLLIPSLLKHLQNFFQDHFGIIWYFHLPDNSCPYPGRTPSPHLYPCYGDRVFSLPYISQLIEAGPRRGGEMGCGFQLSVSSSTGTDDSGWIIYIWPFKWAIWKAMQSVGLLNIVFSACWEDMRSWASLLCHWAKSPLQEWGAVSWSKLPAWPSLSLSSSTGVFCAHSGSHSIWDWV